MPGKKFEDSQRYREMIDEALSAGNESPSDVEEYLSHNYSGPIPTLPTISRIMRDLGYKPVEAKWVKKGKS